MTGKPAFLPLVDLSYTYDLAGNITDILDSVRLEDRSYNYDVLDRLIYAGVFTTQDIKVEERFYAYDKIGNLLSTRLSYQSASLAKGVFHSGDKASSETYTSRYDFYGLSGLGLSSTNYKSNSDSPYIVGSFGPPANGPKGFSLGSFESGAQSASTNYKSVLSFNPSGSSLMSSSSQQGQGITPFVRGFTNIGHTYSGPYSETLINYTYPTNHVRPHAVSSRSNGDTFTYDANGNMTQRVQNSVTWTQTFDAENHLTSVSDGTTTTQYVYDGGGNRVKRIVGTTTTIYVAGMEIELHSGTEDHRTVYYAAGGAFRVVGGSNAGLYYRHTDHLGSTSVLSDSSGNKVANSDVVFAPFGETRVGTLSNLTDLGFTGQRLDRVDGLMYYGARYYLPGLNRFISPDTIIPHPFNPQSYNRYGYVLNNPLRYTDPTGHCDDADGNGKCDAIERKGGIGPGNGTSPVKQPTPASIVVGGGAGYSAGLKEFAVTVDFTVQVDPSSQQTMLYNVYSAVLDIATKTYQTYLQQGGDASRSAADVFKLLFGNKITINVVSELPQGCQSEDPDLKACTQGNPLKGIDIYILAGALLEGTTDYGRHVTPKELLIHEFGHAALTGPCEGGPKCSPQFNGNPGLYSFVNAQVPNNANFPLGVGGALNTARSFTLWAAKEDWDTASPSSSEMTADAFLNWVLNPNVAGEVNVFMNQIVCAKTHC